MSQKSERKQAIKAAKQKHYGQSSAWQQFKKERREANIGITPPSRRLLPLYAAIRGLGARVRIVQPKEDRHVPIRRVDPTGQCDGVPVPSHCAEMEAVLPHEANPEVPNRMAESRTLNAPRGEKE